MSRAFYGIGAWCDSYTPETSRLLRALKPKFAVVGDGAWNHIPEIQADMAPDPLLILRLVVDDLPARTVARVIHANASRYTGRFAAYSRNEPDVNTSPARLRLIEWELDFINECHKRDIPTVCLNLATGNPPGDKAEMLAAMEELRPIHDASDYIGLHLYDLAYNLTDSMDELYTAFRYRLWPAWFDRSKLLSTEIGLDGVGKRFGWRDWGSEQVMINLMDSLADSWRQDSMLGGAFFHLGTMNGEWDSYLATEKLMTALSVYNVSNHNDGYSSLPEVETNMTNEELWQQLTKPYESFPALTKRIVALGGLPIGTEVVLGDYTYQLGLIPMSGSPVDVVIYARTGDWANVKVARRASELPL